jgi:hypothetical protein
MSNIVFLTHLDKMIAKEDQKILKNELNYSTYLLYRFKEKTGQINC